ncbi:MAG: D-amino-acid oxidase [Comamonas sp. SCN 67-35]|uniref:NAD(P)/FAD-dependent oxidoreductase n=1 Tax=unclassified Comamonas TaxID=2638500 RepID=UPI00086D113E|nr:MULTISPECIES: FAD-dependent oxidoreductase [unclassified Comamonas]MBN9328781.1 FAD-binding oxidoreductase [Comamonas sp.]ODU38503.1 MAG: D-amino-acid oxidase [Comamonas sp. SCN 67-35]OJX02076.1 MAG: D-amino-acid oxidase [Burkholderiales bacterium 66-26]
MIADVLIVGAGIIGAACADALAAQGLRVHIVDARLAAATNAGMGHLLILDENPAELALSSRSMQLWRRWQPGLDDACAWTSCGTIWIAANDAEAALARHKQATLAAAGIASEWLDAPMLARTEPALRTGLAGGLRVPSDAAVYAPRVASWLLARHPGRITLTPARVTHLNDDASVQSSAGHLQAGQVLLAAGLGSAALCPELPIFAKKGHLVITDRYPGQVRHQLVELGYMASAHQAEGTSVAVNIQPRPTGQLLIGSTRQFGREDTGVDPSLVARLLRAAMQTLPGLAGARAIRTWAGLRPATSDGLPLIGRHPGREHLWIAAGHEGHGVTTAPATAELIAALMTGDTPALDATPYRPQRLLLSHP